MLQKLHAYVKVGGRYITADALYVCWQLFLDPDFIYIYIYIHICVC